MTGLLVIIMLSVSMVWFLFAADENLRDVATDWLRSLPASSSSPPSGSVPIAIVADTPTPLPSISTPLTVLSPSQHPTSTLTAGPAPTLTAIRNQPEPSPQTSTPAATASPVTTPTAIPTPAAQPTGTPVPPTPEPNATAPPPIFTQTPTPTNTQVPTATPRPTPGPTATHIPVVSLALEAEASVTGYWSDGSADVMLDVMLVNRGSLPSETVQNVKLSCMGEPEVVLNGCGEEFSLTLTDGYGPDSGSLTLRLPMGVQTAVELDYGDEEPFTMEVEVPERILGLERDLFACYVDREPTPDPRLPGRHLHGCGGWATETVEKWLNDVAVKVWATGDPLYIEDFREVLESLSPVLDLDFVWVDSEQQADLRGYVGVQREDIDGLGFQPHTVEYGGFADSSKVAGEATTGYLVVWYIDKDPPTGITLHEALHALVPIAHNTRSLSAVGGSGMALLSPRDEALFRLNAHPLVRPGMTMQEVESLIVFRDELLDAPAPEPVTDPMEMVWRALLSLNDADSAGYNLSGGWTDRQCNQTFGIRRGPLQFKMGQFRFWKDNPAVLRFHDHVNEFLIFWNGEKWGEYVRPLNGTDWRLVTWHEMSDMTNWWAWNGKLHKALRSVLQDGSSDDFTVETGSGTVKLHVQIDQSYVSMGLSSDEEYVDFTLRLNSETHAIEGYRWALHRDPSHQQGNPCLIYEEVATDFELGVEIKLPEEIPE